MPLPSRAALALQAAQGIAYLHDRGWVHFDLKPGNVLVGITHTESHQSVLNIKLGDFGNAMPADHPAIQDPRNVYKRGDIQAPS